jgi:hypothetical protein
VPLGGEAKARQAAAAADVSTRGWLERRGRVLLAVVLVVDAALLAWRLFAH